MNPSRREKGELGYSPKHSSGFLGGHLKQVFVLPAPLVSHWTWATLKWLLTEPETGLELCFMTLDITEVPQQVHGTPRAVKLCIKRM